MSLFTKSVTLYFNNPSHLFYNILVDKCFTLINKMSFMQNKAHMHHHRLKDNKAPTKQRKARITPGVPENGRDVNSQ